MQDKPVHIDDKFTAKAWADMRNMLDQEMPVQPEKRRRLLGWWWLTLLGICVVAGATYLILGKKTMTEAPSNRPVASATLPTASFNKTAQNAAAETEQNLNADNRSAIESPSVLDKKPVTTIQSDKNLVKSKSGNIIKQKTKSEIGTIKANNENYKQPDNFVILNADKISEVGLSVEIRMESPDFLAQASMNPLLNSSEPVLFVANNVGKKHQWEWAFQASGLTIPNLSSGGFALEANAIRASANKRVNFSLGLGYTLLSQPIYAYTVTPINSAAADGNGIVYENSGKAGLEAIDPNIGLSITNKTLKLHYLTAPIQFSYRITNRLNVNAGVSAGLLLASQSGYTTDGIFGNFTAANQDSFLGSSAKNKVSNFDFATIAGIGFVCTPKLSMQLDYVHGITDVLPKNDVGDFNRLLKLGIRYKLSSRY